MNRVCIKTYGCQMNARDSEAVAAMLRARGYMIVADEEDADIVLLNTCSVRDQAEHKAIGKGGYLAKRKKTAPRFIFGMMGCMAQNRGGELIDRLPDLDLVVGTQRFHHVPDYLDRIVAAHDAGIPRPATIVDIEAEEGSQNTIREHIGGKRKVSAFVSIMQGCNMSCAFCIVPKTRGFERSRPIDEIAREIEELTANGTREVTLLGQIVTSYGRDIIPAKDGKSALVQLIERVNDIPGIERIRFTSPHPRGFKRDLVEAYSRLPKLCEHVHLPLQSGSDRILKAMNRQYSEDKYMEIVEGLRAASPSICFSTDVIVGFPGETEEDFDRTRNVFERVGYDMAYIFKYSIRAGTPAQEMAAQVPEAIKEERNQVLLKLLEESSLRGSRSLLGTVQDVLVEGPDKRGGRYMGRTRGNRIVHFDGGERLVGEIVPVRIERATTSALYGEILIADPV